MPGPLPPHDALIYIMVAVSAVDREMTDREMMRIGHLVKNLPVFRDFNINDLIKVSEACTRVLSRDDGLSSLLDEVATRLPKKLHETAYALAVEVAAADLDVTNEEIRFLQLLRDALRIDPLAAAAIERGAKARHQTL